ncbi:FecR family protein [Chitinophaga caseinilytica]|uniref:FecR domain-containing protein n=1 Tax=Chitinophaga caseinilytica TaxID=2267521 RepID=A0ABZ2YXX7_9BACT
MDVDNLPEHELPGLLRAAALTAKEKLHQLTDAEKDELQHWLEQKTQHQEWYDSLRSGDGLSRLNTDYSKFTAAAQPALADFHRQHFPQPTPSRTTKILRASWIRYAAAVFLLLAVAWYFMPRQQPKLAQQPPKPIQQQILPGQEGAILTLADGSTIELDSVGNGVVAQQSGADLSVSNGQLRYKANGKSSAEETFNTLTTPKGRQYKIILPDGSAAWLNAASSIRFPTQFTQNARRVAISGEVYFEVAAMKKAGETLPFIVNADNRFEVEVLGTHFNINAYADEPVLNTTLLQGKVAVTAQRPEGRQKVVLKPGEQAAMALRGGEAGKMTVRPGDPGKVLAWKNGVFDFDDVGIEEVMRQLKRWYDIDVKYAAGVPKIEFVGKMTRDIPLEGLLIALEKSNVHFRLEGRTLIVLP